MSFRQTALVAGVLFIVTFLASIPAVLLYDPVLHDPNYIVGTGADGRVLLGAFLEVILVIANIGTAVVLFPVVKRQNGALALGYVTARLMECTLIVVGIVSLVSVVTLRQQSSGVDSASLLVAGRALVTLHNWTFNLGPSFVAGLGNGLILGYLMYRSALVPRRVALLGVVGGPLVCLSGVAVLLGTINAGSAAQGIATVPEILWEAFLGLWLTFKGFAVAGAVSGDGRTPDIDEDAAAAFAG